MSRKSAYERSTPSSAVANAYQLKRSNSDYDAAMWAACALMSLQQGNPEMLLDYARIWESKVKSGQLKRSHSGQKMK